MVPGSGSERFSRGKWSLVLVQSGSLEVSGPWFWFRAVPLHPTLGVFLSAVLSAVRSVVLLSRTGVSYLSRDSAGGIILITLTHFLPAGGQSILDASPAVTVDVVMVTSRTLLADGDR